MFNIGFAEMLIIGIIVLLVIGPDKMPEFFKTSTQWLVKMRRSVNDVKNTLHEEFEKAAGDDVKELKKLGGDFNLKQRVSMNSLEKYMEDGAKMFTGESKKNDADTSEKTDIVPEDATKNRAFEQAQNDMNLTVSDQINHADMAIETNDATPPPTDKRPPTPNAPTGENPARPE